MVSSVKVPFLPRGGLACVRCSPVNHVWMAINMYVGINEPSTARYSMATHLFVFFFVLEAFVTGPF